MKVLNISEARRLLPSIVDRALRSSQRLSIGRRGVPLVDIVPHRPDAGGPGSRSLRGLPVRVAKDFDRPMPDLWRELRP